MKNKEFNLSEKIKTSYIMDNKSITNINYILTKDVLAFIKSLKKELKKGVVLDCWQNMTIAQIKEQIDYIINQLYGEDLK